MMEVLLDLGISDDGGTVGPVLDVRYFDCLIIPSISPTIVIPRSVRFSLERSDKNSSVMRLAINVEAYLTASSLGIPAFLKKVFHWSTSRSAIMRSRYVTYNNSIYIYFFNISCKRRKDRIYLNRIAYII